MSALNGAATIRAVIDRYRLHCEVNAVHCPDRAAERERTLQAFAAWVPEPGKPALGDWHVSACAAHHLEDWIETNPRWRSSSTRKAKANIVNACFNWARKTKRIPDNPFDVVNYEEAERRPCMPDDTLEVFRAKANKPYERAILFLRLTGCRLSDLFRLRWEHIDWRLEIATLPPKLHKSGRKTRKAKTLVLLPEAVELLKKIKAEDFHDGEIFRNTRGTPWNRRTLGQQLYRMKHRLKVNTNATLHGIRHQTATVAVRNEASLKFVSKFLGHSGQAVTERVYVHVDQDYEAMREALRLAQPAR